MSQDNSLVPLEVGVSKYGTDDAFSELATASNFLPRLQLFGANSDLVKKGKFPMAHWGLVTQKDQADDLGETVDLIPVTWRPKAMRIDGGEGGNPIAFYNPKSPEFVQVQQDSEKPNSGCMFGLEFLCYVPSVRRFASYFMSSKTSRRQAPEMRALLRQGATLKITLIETSQYSWHGPIVTKFHGTFSDLPSKEEFVKQADAFNNPDESSTDFNPEKLEADKAREQARAR